MHLLYRSNNFWKAPWKSFCVSVSMTFITASFKSSMVSWRQPLSLGNNQKSQVWTIGRLRNCWCPSWSNSLWHGWSCGLVHCPGGNATDPIWRVRASPDGISYWTPLKPQHSYSNPLANKLWCSDFFTPPTTLIIPHRLSAVLESITSLKNWCSIHARTSKSSLKYSIHFCGIFSKFKTEFYYISFF